MSICYASLRELKTICVVAVMNVFESVCSLFQLAVRDGLVIAVSFNAILSVAKLYSSVFWILMDVRVALGGVVLTVPQVKLCIYVNTASLLDSHLIFQF